MFVSVLGTVAFPVISDPGMQLEHLLLDYGSRREHANLLELVMRRKV